MENSYMTSMIKQFEYYKLLGEKTMNQVSDEELFWTPHEDGNSIATIVAHLSGNMLSRWTNFLTEDGEKTWRKRDEEFEPEYESRIEVIAAWNAGWSCLFDALADASKVDMEQLVYIRNQGHTVTEAVNRQLAHYAYHIGQLVLLGKMLKGKDWQSLSIPKGASKAYNEEKFAQEKHKAHFSDEYRKES